MAKNQSKFEPNMIIYTLKQKKANEIIEINDSGIIVKTEKGTELVEIEMIRKAWENLVKDDFSTEMNMRNQLIEARLF